MKVVYSFIAAMFFAGLPAIVAGLLARWALDSEVWGFLVWFGVFAVGLNALTPKPARGEHWHWDKENK